VKSADIEVGQEYAYRSWSYNTPRRVKVVAKNLPYDYRDSYKPHYHRVAIKNGVRIQLWEDGKFGHETVVASKTIDVTWAVQEQTNRIRREKAALAQAEKDVRDSILASFNMVVPPDASVRVYGDAYVTLEIPLKYRFELREALAGIFGSNNVHLDRMSSAWQRAYNQPAMSAWDESSKQLSEAENPCK
jgi:hypothetical protein